MIRSRDGTVVTSWDEKPGGRSVMTSLSPSRTALGLLRRSASDSKQFEVTVYAVRGNRLVPTGLLVDLPGSASVMPADDGRSIVEETRAAEGTRLVWPLSASAPTSATDPARAKKVSEDVSPLARYEIRKEKTEGDRQPTFDVVQRSNGTTIKRLAGGSWRFSADDRWVVAWQNYGEAKGLRVLDLSSGEFALSIDPGYVDKVEFEARNTILKIVLDNGTMLVPLERGLMAQFARALTSRTLTTQERCLYGLGGAECRTQVAASRAPGPAASRAPGPVQKGASAPKQTRPASGTR